MRRLEDILLESRLRADNLKAAVQLGLFGTDRTELIKNVSAFNINNGPRIDKTCAELRDVIINQGDTHD
jgi:hypothetical protein